MEPREPIYVGCPLLCMKMKTIWWSAKMMHRIEKFSSVFQTLDNSVSWQQMSFRPPRDSHILCLCCDACATTHFFASVELCSIVSVCVCVLLFRTLSKYTTTATLTNHEQVIQKSEWERKAKKQTISTQQKCVFSLLHFLQLPTGSIKFTSEKEKRWKKSHHTNKKFGEHRDRNEIRPGVIDR